MNDSREISGTVETILHFKTTRVFKVPEDFSIQLCT